MSIHISKQKAHLAASQLEKQHNLNARDIRRSSGWGRIRVKPQRFLRFFWQVKP